MINTSISQQSHQQNNGVNERALSIAFIYDAKISHIYEWTTVSDNIINCNYRDCGTGQSATTTEQGSLPQASKAPLSLMISRNKQTDKQTKMQLLLCQLCNGLDPETVEARPKGPREEAGFWGGAAGSGSTACNVGLPQRGPWQSPGKFGFWSILGLRNHARTVRYAFRMDFFIQRYTGARKSGRLRV